MPNFWAGPKRLAWKEKSFFYFLLMTGYDGMFLLLLGACFDRSLGVSCCIYIFSPACSLLFPFLCFFAKLYCSVSFSSFYSLFLGNYQKQTHLYRVGKRELLVTGKHRERKGKKGKERVKEINCTDFPLISIVLYILLFHSSNSYLAEYYP